MLFGTKVKWPEITEWPDPITPEALEVLIEQHQENPKVLSQIANLSILNAPLEQGAAVVADRGIDQVHTQADNGYYNVYRSAIGTLEQLKSAGVKLVG